MRWLLLLSGCTLIIGDRNSSSGFDLASPPGDGMMSAGDGGMNANCSVNETLVTGANQIALDEAADVAAVGAGGFVVTFAQQNQQWMGLVNTGALDSNNPGPEMMQGPYTVHTCANACADPRVAPADSLDSTLWFTTVDGFSTVLQQMDRGNFRATGTTLVSDCGALDRSATLAQVGGNVLAVTACAAEMRRVGTSVTDGKFEQVTGALEVRAQSLPKVGFVGWVQQDIGNHFAATVELVDPASASTRNAIMFPQEVNMIHGFAFGALDAVAPDPSRIVVAYNLGTDLWIYPATLNGSVGGSKMISNVVPAGPHTPLGVAAGPGYFLVAYSDASGTEPPHPRLQRVSSAGLLEGDAIDLGKLGLSGFSPRIAWSQEGDRFGVTYVGPASSANLTERLAHFAVVKCQ